MVFHNFNTIKIREWGLAKLRMNVNKYKSFWESDGRLELAVMASQHNEYTKNYFETTFMLCELYCKIVVAPTTTAKNKCYSLPYKRITLWPLCESSVMYIWKLFIHLLLKLSLVWWIPNIRPSGCSIIKCTVIVLLGILALDYICLFFIRNKMYRRRECHHLTSQTVLPCPAYLRRWSLF